MNNRTRPLCSIPGCGKPHVGRGWCRNHYGRWSRHGDPLAGRVPPGEPMRWLLALIAEASTSPDDACRTNWPFVRHKGYPQINSRGAHHVVLELTGRPRPFPEAHGRHLCGNGHLGCLHPRHLEWGTRLQNAADMVGHGRSNRGEKSPTSKLTADDVRAIRASDELQDVLAERYSIAQSTVSKIRLRYRWAHLPG